MRLSPLDPFIGVFRQQIAGADLNLGQVDAAIDEYRQAIDSGFRPYYVYMGLSAAYAQAGKMEEAKTALAEARRLNPKLTVKWLIDHSPGTSAGLDRLRKAGLPEE
jgi:tetratricopeptide (TPR) repeat protein